MRLVLVLPLALLGLATGCGVSGSGTTSTVGKTTTVERTATTAAGTAAARRRGARQLASDLCASLPVRRIAQLAGVGGSDGDVAAGLASNVRPELRAAARQGCLAALRQK